MNLGTLALAVRPRCGGSEVSIVSVYVLSYGSHLSSPSPIMGICSTADWEPRPSSFSNKPEYILQFNECKLFTAAFMSINIFYRDSILYFYHRGGTGVSLMLLSPLRCPSLDIYSSVLPSVDGQSISSDSDTAGLMPRGGGEEGGGIF